MNISQNSYQKFLDKAIEVMAIVGFTGLVLIAFMTLIDVFFRYIGFSRISGLNDVEEVAFAIVIASCFPAGLRKGNAVTVRILGSLLGNKFYNWFEVFGSLLTLLFFSLVFYQFCLFSLDYFYAGRTTSTLELLVWPVWFSVTLIMFSCICVQFLIFYYSIVAAFNGVSLHFDTPKF